ncbi:MAG: amidohydrolase family protein, partial [Thermoanaerobaculia bacterium]|nr:amidohydrolase family protein [Thermoanaerobaculia bacterium]
MESRLKRCVLALILVPLLGTADAGAETAAPNQGIRHQNPAVDAFVGARIVTAPGEIVEDGILVVRDGRIEAVGSDLEIPADAVVHDLDGKSVYPGFIDPYTEYGLGHLDRLNPPHEEEGPKYEGNREGADSWNDAVHAERRWVEELRPDDETASKLRKQGITSVHSSKMDGIFRGRGFVTGLREGLANEVVRRPHGLHLLSWDKGSSEQSYPSSLMGSIALIRQTLLDADWYRRARDAHRRNPSLDSPELNRPLEALAGYEGAFLFQVSDELDLLRAGRIAREMDRPFVYVGTNREYQRLEEIRALDRPIVLPLHFPDKPAVGSLEEELDVTLADLRHWERAPSNPSVLAENGIEIAFTTHGLEDGEKLLGQVRKTIDRGLSEERALAALTTVPANLLGVLEDSGTLEEGKRADFLIAEGNLFSEDGELLSVWGAVKGVGRIGQRLGFPDFLKDNRGESVPKVIVVELPHDVLLHVEP